MIKGMLKVSYTSLIELRAVGPLIERNCADCSCIGKEGAAPKEGMAEALEDTKDASANIMGGA